MLVVGLFSVVDDLLAVAGKEFLESLLGHSWPSSSLAALAFLRAFPALDIYIGQLDTKGVAPGERM